MLLWSCGAKLYNRKIAIEKEEDTRDGDETTNSIGQLIIFQRRFIVDVFKIRIKRFTICKLKRPRRMIIML